MNLHFCETVTKTTKHSICLSMANEKETPYIYCMKQVTLLESVSTMRNCMDVALALNVVVYSFAEFYTVGAAMACWMAAFTSNSKSLIVLSSLAVAITADPFSLLN